MSVSELLLIWAALEVKAVTSSHMDDRVRIWDCPIGYDYQAHTGAAAPRPSMGFV
jgi:hypothetical protein